MNRTVSEAQEAVHTEPKRWRAAVCESKVLPILDDPDCLVKLYATKKGAHEALRARTQELVTQGWTRSLGTLARGVLVFERDTETVGLALDYAGRRNPQA